MTVADPHITQVILRLVEGVAKDENAIGVLSTGEQIAVALVLDRHDLIKGGQYESMREAVQRKVEFTPGPWKVYHSLLRPQFPGAKIIEVQDADGNAIVQGAGY